MSSEEREVACNSREGGGGSVWGEERREEETAYL